MSIIFQDQLQRSIPLSKTPQRIISLVPSQTELLADLGLEKQIVGVTKFCVHPKDIRHKTVIVGGTKQMDMEKIKALQPDIILCNKEENTQAMVQEMSQYFPVHVSDVNQLKDAYKLIEQYGSIFKVESKAFKIVENIKNVQHKFQAFIKDKPRLKVAYFIWRKPWMVVGGNTFINKLLKLNHFENVYKDQVRYPEIQLEKLKTCDLILLSSEPFPFEEKHKMEILPHVGNAKVEFVDGEFYSWYGSRLEKSFEYFKVWYERTIED